MTGSLVLPMDFATGKQRATGMLMWSEPCLRSESPRLQTPQFSHCLGTVNCAGTFQQLWHSQTPGAAAYKDACHCRICRGWGGALCLPRAGLQALPPCSHLSGVGPLQHICCSCTSQGSQQQPCLRPGERVAKESDFRMYPCDLLNIRCHVEEVVLSLSC